MNFLSGKVQRNGSAHVEVGGQRLPLPESAAARDGQPVVYGIRPEHLEFTESDDGIEAEVTVVEPTGSEILVVAKLAGQDLNAVFRERHDFAPGQKIRLRPKLDLIHLFDGDSGVRM